jgi:hypothetical protein
MSLEVPHGRQRVGGEMWQSEVVKMKLRLWSNRRSTV